MEEYFVFLQNLGQGSYGTVYSAASTAKSKRDIGPDLPDMVAIKQIIPQKPAHLPRIRDEIRILKHIDNEYTMKYYGCYTTDDGDAYIITELVPGKDLFTLIKRNLLSNEDKKIITIKLGLGIAALHSYNIAHRDIKPGNIMYDRGSERLTILDYGFSCLRTSDPVEEESIGLCRGNAGSPRYIDHKLKEDDLESMKKSDWWSYGQVIYVLWTKDFLYKPEKVPPSYAPMSDDLTFPFAELIRRIVDPMLSQDKRPTEEKIIAVLTRG